MIISCQTGIPASRISLIGTHLLLVSHCFINKLPQFSGWKQHSIITVLQCWRSEVWYKSHWVKIKVWVGLYSFLGTLGEKSVSLSFLASSGLQHSLVHGLLPPSSQSATLHPSYPASISTSFSDFFCLPLLLFRTPVIVIGPTWISQAALLVW